MDTVKVLITADFYSNYELYETNDLEDLKAWITAMVNHVDKPLDETKHKMIGYQDNMSTDEAIKQADIEFSINDFPFLEELPFCH